MSPGTLRAALCVPATHPALAGHFPGRPIVPAVLLLDALAELLQQHGLQLLAVDSAKFLVPLLPQQPVTLCLQAQDAEHWQFSVLDDATLVVRGTLRVADA